MMRHTFDLWAACTVRSAAHSHACISRPPAFYLQTFTSHLKCTTSALSHSCALQVSKFLFGDGFAITEGDMWRVRRRDVQPALHKTYLDIMIAQVFGPSAHHLAEKLEVRSPSLA